MTKEQKLKKIWSKTHKDFRGKIDGVKMIMLFRSGLGTCLVPLEALTDQEIEKFSSYWN